MDIKCGEHINDRICTECILSEVKDDRCDTACQKAGRECTEELTVITILRLDDRGLALADKAGCKREEEDTEGERIQRHPHHAVSICGAKRNGACKGTCTEGERSVHKAGAGKFQVTECALELGLFVQLLQHCFFF